MESTGLLLMIMFFVIERCIVHNIGAQREASTTNAADFRMNEQRKAAKYMTYIVIVFMITQVYMTINDTALFATDAKCYQEVNKEAAEITLRVITGLVSHIIWLYAVLWTFWPYQST